MKRFYVIGFAALLGFDTLAQVSFKLAGMHALPLQPNVAWVTRLFSEPWVYGVVVATRYHHLPIFTKSYGLHRGGMPFKSPDFYPGLFFP